MTELELLISRYLDGELTSAQAERLRQMLADSPDARATLREMRSIARSARHSPLMHSPSPATERTLFERLRAEGFGLARNPEPARRPTATAGLFTAYARRAVPALMVAAVALVGLSWLLTPPATQEPFASRTVAAAVAPAAPLPSILAPRTAVDEEEVRSETTSLSRGGRAIRTSGVVVSDASSSDNVLDHSNPPPPTPITPPIVAPEEGPSDQALDSPAQYASPIPIAIMLPLETTQISDPRLEAVVSAGASMIDRGRKVADALTFGIGLAVADGHRVSLLGGRSAAVTERRATNTLSVVSRSVDDDKAGPGLLRSDGSPNAYEVDVRQEWWVGLGYAVRVWRAGPVDLDIGMRAGIGEEAWRVGGEVPVRLRLGRDVSLSAAMTVSHVQPHSRARSEFGIESRPDGYLFEAESGQTTFTTVGAELGIRVALD